MSSAWIGLAFAVWHLTWNIVLNKARGLKQVSIEQITVSMIVGVALQTIAGWSARTAIVLLVAGSLAYYLNLVHSRFFGHLIPLSQIKRFLTSADSAASSGAMLVQMAGRLTKWRDVYFLILMAEALAIPLIVPNPVDSLWHWQALNGLLLVLIALTLRQYRRLKKGGIDPHLFGMFVSYYFNWSLARRRREERERLERECSDRADEAAEESDDPPGDEWFGKFKGMNLILIQVESFQQFVLHRQVDGQEITPFLNRMANENIAFTDIFSQYAQGHTCDAELASLQSLYPLKHEVVNYKHYDKYYCGLPRILRNHGYQAMAYHGYKGDFYNRRTMMNTYGFEAFFSEEDYLATDRASYWMSDFSFFEQSVEKIKAMKQPFFSFMITMTSHFPFELEEEHWGLRLGPDVPEPLARYYQSVNYTDRALRHFYERLHREGLLDNTVVAFYGDHEGVSLEHLPILYEELGIPQSNLLKDTNRMGVAKVPFVIASGDPSRRIAFASDTVGSTMDVGQTLLHLLGMPKIGYGMGASLFAAPKDRVVPLTQYPSGSFATRDTLCYASESGDYAYSVLFDRGSGTLVLPVSGLNRRRFEYSREQVDRSEYLLVNDLLAPADPSNEAEAEEAGQAAFAPNVERMLSIADDEAIVIPVSLSMDQWYASGQGNDMDGMKRLEEFYRRTRNKNIRFYSTLELDTNERPIYFGDWHYADYLIAKGYQVEPVESVPLPRYLRRLPDHSLIVAAARDEASSQFVPKFAEEMAEFGFHRLNDRKYRHSYANLIYKNKGCISLYEEVSESPIEKGWESGTFVNGVALPCDLQVTSQGALAGNLSEIRVNGLSCSRNQRGLNFAVVDMATGKLTETFRADTFSTVYVDTEMYRAVKAKPSGEERP
ncbi:sulfatase-like hydrolase/transferase [Paenibacillaceae bacterium WGS1546]|uniref:sulfatase-like hydrolase/transferase n=1 Tax=Cohnella sp. WGS1546 TaxID=3366810 RepID=UPI00372D5700